MPLTDAGHITEFYAGYNGTCGECALEVADAACNHRKADLNDMVAIVHEMQAHGGASSNGASTLYSLAREAERRGLPILTEWDYAKPFPHDWHSVLLANQGKNPIILQLANGQALRDAETGAADEVGLKYHFIVILGGQADGYIANDGDNPQVSSRFQVYSYGDLDAAVICGLLMLSPLASPQPVTLPTGWKDDGTTLFGPNGVPVTLGFRDQLLFKDPTLFARLGEPLKPAYSTASVEPGNPGIGAGTRQDFQMGSLGWTQSRGVYVVWVGQDIEALEAEVADLQTQLNLAKGLLDRATAKIAAAKTALG